MADQKQRSEAAKDEKADEVDDAMSEAAGETVKVPDQAESEPADVEGSESKLP